MDIRVLFSQLRPWMGIKIFFFTAFNHLLNPYANIFFGISAEDQVIDTLLKHPKRGYYVDVGCNQPIRFSNTFNFYLRGWKGLTIDANPELIALQKKIRPKDNSVCCVVSDSEKEVIFTKFHDNNLSSISPGFTAAIEKSVAIISKESVKTKTLNSIFLENNVPNEFEFLSIDVEGHDFEVLRGIDLTKYSPSLIIIEMIDFSFINYRTNKIVKYLKDKDFQMVGYYSVNGFFLRKDKNPPE
jgi:FkbM family methyltransferase